eukprot:gene25339-25480_t
MQISPDDPLLLRIVDDLAVKGWSQQNIFLPEALTLELAAECHKRAAEGELAPAAVGRGPAQEIREGIRGDHIQWLEPGQAAICDRYLALMDSLRLAMNRGLFLGLEEFECHFAMYPPGAFYLKHLDRFRDDDRRMVSAVVYLNQDWLPEHGGQLRMYLKDGVEHDVDPTGGCLVVFLSGEVPHEVLPAHRERLSLTGCMQKILVSRCLLGHRVRYDGGASGPFDQLATWQAEGRVVAVCPEVAGGLPTPRPSAEIPGGQGMDVWEGRAQVLT